MEQTTVRGKQVRFTWIYWDGKDQVDPKAIEDAVAEGAKFFRFIDTGSSDNFMIATDVQVTERQGLNLYERFVGGPDLGGPDLYNIPSVGR